MNILETTELGTLEVLFNAFKFYLRVCVCVWRLFKGIRPSENGVTGSCEAVIYLLWVLGPESGFFASAASLNHGDISLALGFCFVLFFV